MKIAFQILTLATLLISFSLCQEKDSLIQLYPGMGDTLDHIDREIFELYPDIDGYIYAELFLRDKKFLVSKITYSNSLTLCDTILVEDISKFSDVRIKLSQFLVDNDKKFESPLEASVFTNPGNKFDGKLQMFSKSFLFLNSDIDYLTGISSQFKFKTPVTSVDSLMIHKKRNMFPYVGGGALVGFLGGFLIGTATFEDDWGADKEVKWMVSGGIGALVGGLLGWLIGESLPPDYVIIKFNSPYDVTKLKDYSAYYFQYDKTLEINYVELK